MTRSLITHAHFPDDPFEADVLTRPDRAAAARGVHACLSYLLNEVERLQDGDLTAAIQSAIRAAACLVSETPDLRH